MGRERMNPAIFGHVQNEPSHTRHHRSSRKEFYWICIDQSKNSRELNNGFSCWWILFFAFFHSLHRSLIMKRWCQNHQQMRSERRTPHHWIRNEIPKIKLNWQVFYLRIKITSKILQMELKRLEIFISFHFIIFNEFFFLAQSTVWSGQISNVSNKPWHAENFFLWFWMAQRDDTIATGFSPRWKTETEYEYRTRWTE